MPVAGIGARFQGRPGMGTKISRTSLRMSYPPLHPLSFHRNSTKGAFSENLHTAASSKGAGSYVYRVIEKPVHLLFFTVTSWK